MDYDIGYYTTDYEMLRLTERQLYSWQAIPGHNLTPAPDMASGPPVVSADGKTVTVTLRPGIMWNTTPPRPVTALDVVRGIVRACNNSVNSFGGMADFEKTIVGLPDACAGYPKAAGTNAAVMKAYIEKTITKIAGIKAVDATTLQFTLTAPAAWLTGAMTLPPFSAVPIEAEAGLPGSPQVYSHMYADGPYTVSQYTPAKKIVFVRNPQWQASTDPLRKAYVDQINVDETGEQTVIYQQVRTDSPQLAFSWDALPPPSDFPYLQSQLKTGSQNVNLGPTYSFNPYMIFNTISPNNGGALGKVAVRQALSYATDRSQLIKVLGGTATNSPLTHVIPPGTAGAQDVPNGYDPYPYNPDKAKTMLAAAGFSASHPLVLKFLYRNASQGSTKIFNNFASQMTTALGGIVQVTGVTATNADFYSKYLQVAAPPAQTPAGHGVWDISLAGWGPDWYGNGTLTDFLPLFYAPNAFPVNGGSDFSYYQSSTVNGLIDQALAQSDEASADQYWAKADQQIMADDPYFPITEPLQFLEHASYVHNAVYMPQFQNFDLPNVWLSSH